MKKKELSDRWLKLMAMKHLLYPIISEEGILFSHLLDLLPIAISGLDIRMLVKGAKSMEELTRNNKHAETNPSLLYASARNLLLQNGINLLK
jgi:hypothetical protein